MATSLAQFLIRLTREPELLEAFHADATATMNEAEVSSEDQYVLREGDLDALKAAVGAQDVHDELPWDEFWM